MSQNNWITCVLFSCRDDGWTGPDTCIRTSRGNAWFTTGVMQSFALPSKSPRTQPQLPQTFAVGVCPKLILLQVLVSCAANLPRYAMFSMPSCTSPSTVDLPMATKLCFPTICHRLNTFWEQRNTQHAVQATIATKKKARYSLCAPVNTSLATPRSANHLPPKRFFFDCVTGRFFTI